MTGFMLHGLGDCTPARHCGCLDTQPEGGRTMKIFYHEGSPLAHTIAIAEAAREYVRLTYLAKDPLNVGEWARARRALFAAVEAEQTEKEET